MADWTAFDFLDALDTGLNARTALMTLDPAPKVFSYMPAEQEFSSDMVIFGYEVTDTKDEENIGPTPTHSEIVTVEGMVMVARPDGSTAVTDARDRAETLIGHVDAYLRESVPSVGTQTIYGRVGSRTLRQFPSEGLRFCEVEFTITYKARTA